jgi:hypothetical protein
MALKAASQEVNVGLLYAFYFSILFAAFLISFPVNIVKKVLIFSVSAES